MAVTVGDRAASPDSVSAGIAEQDALVVQNMDADAIALADQNSVIAQGEDGEDD